MRKTYEFPVIHGILAKSADAHAHAVLIVHVQVHLRSVVLLKILNELLGSTGKCKLLRNAGKASELLDQLLLRGLFLKLYKHCSRMAIQNGHADTLAGDHGARRGNDRIYYIVIKNIGDLPDK